MTRKQRLPTQDEATALLVFYLELPGMLAHTNTYSPWPRHAYDLYEAFLWGQFTPLTTRREGRHGLYELLIDHSTCATDGPCAPPPDTPYRMLSFVPSADLPRIVLHLLALLRETPVDDEAETPCLLSPSRP